MLTLKLYIKLFIVKHPRSPQKAPNHLSIMVSSEDILIVKVVASVVGVCATFFALIRTLRSRARRKDAEASRGKVASKSNKSSSKRVPNGEIRKRYKEALEKIVTARLKKESTTTSEEPVFLSHYISQGQFRHWVLHVHNHKYELRQRAVDQSNPEPYYAAISESGFNFQQYQRSITLHYSPEVGNYFYSLIGWTKYSKEKVDHKCHRVFKNFGKYSLLSNNCHDFLQSLASDIVTTKAPDWSWLCHSTVGGYHYIKKPTLGYNVISSATWSKQLDRTKHYLSTEERQKIEDFIIILEGHVETHLSQSVRNLALSNMINSNNDAVFFSNGTMQFDSGGHDGRGHDAGGGHDGGGGHSGGGHDGGGGGGGGC